MHEASNLGAELAFVTRTLTTGVLAEIRRVIRGDLYGLARVGAMIAGIALAGLGHLSGALRLRLSGPRSGSVLREPGRRRRSAAALRREPPTH